MNKLKHIVLIAVLVCSGMYLSSCKCKKETAQTPPDKTVESTEGYTPATVIFYELDGCKWMLLLENGAKLQPQGMLPEAFQKDQLKVWVKYEMQKGAPNICMAGE